MWWAPGCGVCGNQATIEALPFRVTVGLRDGRIVNPAPSTRELNLNLGSLLGGVGAAHRGDLPRVLDPAAHALVRLIMPPDGVRQRSRAPTPPSSLALASPHLALPCPPLRPPSSAMFGGDLRATGPPGSGVGFACAATAECRVLPSHGFCHLQLMQH